MSERTLFYWSLSPQFYANDWEYSIKNYKLNHQETKLVVLSRLVSNGLDLATSLDQRRQLNLHPAKLLNLLGVLKRQNLDYIFRRIWDDVVSD